ncbi:Protein CBG10293 [Caenorhabditis briggsae]|uniref:Uncharacterized protein n=2 Tax=Caenorhabditis briggsae TaxID=6238 RepID=A0AAE9IWS4_CAEBR|nr:Protein CBG10293 [Caenorhabditis briggsae]ULU08375.1 hypothetical protein L3Y34_019507 [Caenorhabditis briggsae]CAP29703.2 Protein CBG10293 [Caenorhabditis briggsae]
MNLLGIILPLLVVLGSAQSQFVPSVVFLFALDCYVETSTSTSTTLTLTATSKTTPTSSTVTTTTPVTVQATTSSDTPIAATSVPTSSSSSSTSTATSSPESSEPSSPVTSTESTPDSSAASPSSSTSPVVPSMESEATSSSAPTESSFASSSSSTSTSISSESSSTSSQESTTASPGFFATVSNYIFGSSATSSAPALEDRTTTISTQSSSPTKECHTYLFQKKGCDVQEERNSCQKYPEPEDPYYVHPDQLLCTIPPYTSNTHLAMEHGFEKGLKYALVGSVEDKNRLKGKTVDWFLNNMQQLNIFIAIDKRKKNYYLDATKLCDENLGNCVKLLAKDVEKFIYWNCTSKLEKPYDYNRRMHARLAELRK